MTKLLFVLLTVAALLISTRLPAFAVDITGKQDQTSGTNWQTAYMVLNPVRDFKKGDRIVIQVGGSAEWVKVRFLPLNGNSEQPTGLIDSKMKVPAGGKLVVRLSENRPRVKQISVHAGKEAWGDQLNTNGGETKILRIDLNP